MKWVQVYIFRDKIILQNEAVTFIVFWWKFIALSVIFYFFSVKHENLGWSNLQNFTFSRRFAQSKEAEYYSGIFS